jgi:inorganic pyrophosphatase
MRLTNKLGDVFEIFFFISTMEKQRDSDISSHEIEGVERLKYQIRKDMILWVVTRQRKTKYDYVHDYGTKINHQINILY